MASVWSNPGIVSENIRTMKNRGLSEPEAVRRSVMPESVGRLLPSRVSTGLAGRSPVGIGAIGAAGGVMDPGGMDQKMLPAPPPEDASLGIGPTKPLPGSMGGYVPGSNSGFTGGMDPSNQPEGGFQYGGATEAPPNVESPSGAPAIGSGGPSIGGGLEKLLLKRQMGKFGGGGFTGQ